MAVKMPSLLPATGPPATRLPCSHDFSRAIDGRLPRSPRALSAAERTAVLALGTDLARVWDAPTTSDRDRKELLRTLLEDVIVARNTETMNAHLTMRWRGGLTNTLDICLSTRRLAPLRTDDDTIALVRRLAVRGAPVLGITAALGVSLAAFRAVLQKDGVPYDRFREDVRAQIVITRLREREVDDRIEVSESEIDLYLEENKGGGAARNEYNLAHVLIRLPEQASPERIESARARAEKARAEALAGVDFARVAAAHSDAPDAIQGGVLGWRPEDRLPELFVSALRGMRPGDVSEVLRSPGGFHLIKLIERRGAESGPVVTQTRVRHILLRTNEVVSEAEARRRLLDLRQRVVVGGVDFAELARLHSQDGSAARGGELGWVLPGDTVPEFERAMNELKPGDTSEPVKTPFGWHLLQVMERRQGGLTLERRRLQARQALRERRADEAYEEWLRQLRDRSYVEIRLDDR